MKKKRPTPQNDFTGIILHYFNSDEAEVYKQGSQLIIRLKAIQFPVGKDIIMPKNYEVLSIVQKSISMTRVWHVIDNWNSLTRL